MSLDLLPLTPQVAACQRGGTFELGPDRVGPLRIFEFTSVCVRGELLGVTLGLREEGRECCHPPGCDDNFALPMVRAQLEWGLGNACFFAEADFLNGTVLAVVAENLKVCAKYIVFGDLCSPLPPWLPTFKVSAGVGYMARSANSNPAPFTELVTAAPGQTTTIPIPNFALSLTVQPLESPPGPTPALTTIFVRGPCGPRVRYDVVAPLSNLGQHNVENALPLFNGATFIEVDNTLGTAPLAVFLIFGLAL